MKRYLALSLLMISTAFLGNVIAQTTAMPQIYFIQNDVKVLVNNKPQSSPWSGGVNNPQFDMVDLNRDGKKDLIIYESNIAIQTYINHGVAGAPDYVYDGNYEYNFPEELRGYVRITDYNRDSIPDLVHKGNAGFSVYQGYWSDNNLRFKPYKELYYYKWSGWINAYVDPSDMPAILDVDGDGDVDFLSFTISGNRIGYYRNCQVEEGLPKDSIKICFADECWGKFYQDVQRHMQLAYSCDNLGTSCKGCPSPDGSGGKTTHQGNTLCLFDYEGDGDYDVLNGNISYSDIQFLKNGKANTTSKVDTIIAQDSTWSANGQNMIMQMFPGAYALDFDQDGDNDLLFSPSAKDYENYNCVSYYQNNGTPTAPNYFFQSKSFMVDDMIDIGSYSHPVFFDYNRDGKPDLFISSAGYFVPGDGSMKRMISYYENISDKGYPTYKLITKDFMNLGNHNLKGYGLSFGDVDNDGKDDMVIGQDDGTIIYYSNTAANNTVQPQWPTTGEVLKYGGNNTIDVGNYATPIVYDLDTDGKSDLIIGSAQGYIYYYRGIGVQGTAGFEYVTDSVGGVHIQEYGYPNSYPVPFIGAIDDSKKPYLLISSYGGHIYVFDGFQNGNATGPYTMLDSAYQNFKPGPRASVATADIDGDGKYEMVVGNELGGLKLYRQMFDAGTNDKIFTRTQVTVYPNPANDVLNLSWGKEFSNADINIRLVNATGQTVALQTASHTQTSAQLQVKDLPSGIYYCIVQSADNKAVNPVTIVR